MSKIKQPVAVNAVQEIITLHNEIVGALRTTLPKAIRAGELLRREHDKLKHGEWLPWLEKNLPTITDRTARNYIQVYENRDRLKLEKVSDLSSAYRLLKAPKADTVTSPAPAKQVERATKGDKRAAWQMSKEQAAEHRRDDDKSEPMLFAKRGWKKMTKKERAEFWTWILNHGEKHRMGTFLQTCKLTRMLIATVPHSLLCAQPGIDAVRGLLSDFASLTPFFCDVPKCGANAKRTYMLCSKHGTALLKVINEATEK